MAPDLDATRGWRGFAVLLSVMKGRRPKFSPAGLQQADAAGEAKEAFIADENLGADSALETLASRTPP
jgi:hypothetical protein